MHIFAFKLPTCRITHRMVAAIVKNGRSFVLNLQQLGNHISENGRYLYPVFVFPPVIKIIAIETLFQTIKLQFVRIVQVRLKTGLKL